MGLSSNIIVYKCILLINRDLFNCNLFEYCDLLPMSTCIKATEQKYMQLHVELYLKEFNTEIGRAI